ncbi:MAG: L-lactate dehydrogenase [Candidatus Micrarchaeota archaeon]
MNKCGFKVSIVGAGFVGATAAYAMLIKQVANEIALIDVNREKAEGEAMDLADGLAIVGGGKVEYGSDYNLCRGSDVVVVTAGANQKPGQTRLDLLKTNAAIFKKIIPQIAKAAPNAVLLIVTNPVDVMTHLALKYSKFPRNRVFGSGTALDTARLKHFLGQALSVNPCSVDAYILGEHGDSEFPMWSNAAIGEIPLKDYPRFNEKKAEAAFKQTNNAASEIISRKGATYYAIGLVVSDLVQAVLNDHCDVMPVSTHINNYYGVSGICLSVPCVVGTGGVKKQLFPKLDKKEQTAFKKSAAIIKKAIDSI